MVSPKSVLLFISGCIAGIVLTAVLLSPGARAFASTKVAGPFADVPASHPAAQAVAELKAKGIVTGYPDDTYHGSQPVTRYELAVTLARFAKYYDKSTQPLVSVPAKLPTAPTWAIPSREYLASNQFVPASSAIFQLPGTSDVTADQLADSVSTILDRITDRSMPLQHP